MQKLLTILILAISLFACTSPKSSEKQEMATAPEVAPQAEENSKQLRHVVLFKFKESSTEADIAKECE